MSMVDVCRMCGREHEPTPDAIRAGTWQRCPGCRLEPGGAMSCGDISPRIHPGDLVTADERGVHA